MFLFDIILYINARLFYICFLYLYALLDWEIIDPFTT